MNINSRITLGISRFFKKYGKIILIVFIVWLFIFLLNQYLIKNKKPENTLKQSYKPDIPVVTDNSKFIPEKYKATLKDTIKKYFDYCNTGDFQSAYNMLGDDCKSFLYDNNVENFKEYYSNVFTGGKKYYIQNYSNVDDYYIYDFYVMDDIEATGGTNAKNENKEKICLRKVNDRFTISNQGYVGNKKFNIEKEDENLKFTLESKDISYKNEGYNFLIKNKTDKYIVIADNSYETEVELNLGDQKRTATNLQQTNVIIAPNSTVRVTFIFSKYADDGKNPSEVNFNDVRLFENYKIGMDPEKASGMYSFNFKIR